MLLCKKLIVLLLFSVIAIGAIAQPTTARYWVGSLTGNFNGNNWAATSGGGSPGASLGNVNTNYIFDGAGTANQTYTVTLDILTLGFLTVTNNTTVILRSTTTSGTTNYNFAGYNVAAGSKLIVENASTTGTLRMTSPTTSYQSVINGELEARATSSTVQLDFSNFALGTSCDIFGTLRTTATASSASISASTTKLSFKAGSNLIINTDNGTSFTADCDPAMTVTITGAGVAGSANNTTSYLTSFSSWGNVVYNCPNQTISRPIFGGGGVIVKGNLTVVNTGTGKVTFFGTGSSNADTLRGNLVIQGSSQLSFFNTANPATASTVVVNGNLDVQGGTFDLNSAADGTASTLLLRGSFSNAGTLTETGAATNVLLDLAGSSIQNISNTGSIANDVSIRLNNAAGFNLQTALNLAGGLNASFNFLRGILNGNGNALTVNNPNVSGLLGGADTSYLNNGILVRTTSAAASYFFPVGLSRYAPAYIIPATGAGNTYSVSYVNNGFGTYTVSAPLDHVSKKEYWIVQRIAGSDNVELGLQINNFAFSGVNVNRNILSSARYTGASWTELSNGAITDIVPGTSFWLKALNVGAFGQFTVADRLAIGAGGNGLGDITALAPNPVVNNGLSILGIFPNPANEQLQISIVSEKQAEISLAVYDVNGKLIWSEHKRILAGTSFHAINISNLAGGQYFIKMTGNGSTCLRSFIRN